MAYDWPGNIRQLENTIFRAVVLCDGESLTVNEFPQIAHHASERPIVVDTAPPLATPVAAAMPASPVVQDPIEQPPVPIPSAQPDGMREAPFGFVRALDESGHVRPIEDVEADMIRIALDHYRGRMAEVARRLKIGRSTLYRKVRDYGLDATLDGEAAE